MPFTSAGQALQQARAARSSKGNSFFTPVAVDRYTRAREGRPHCRRPRRVRVLRTRCPRPPVATTARSSPTPAAASTRSTRAASRSLRSSTRARSPGSRARRISCCRARSTSTPTPACSSIARAAITIPGITAQPVYDERRARRSRSSRTTSLLLASSADPARPGPLAFAVVASGKIVLGGGALIDLARHAGAGARTACTVSCARRPGCRRAVAAGGGGGGFPARLPRRRRRWRQLRRRRPRSAALGGRAGGSHRPARSACCPGMPGGHGSNNGGPGGAAGGAIDLIAATTIELMSGSIVNGGRRRGAAAGDQSGISYGDAGGGGGGAGGTIIVEATRVFGPGALVANGGSGSQELGRLRQGRERQPRLDVDHAGTRQLRRLLEWHGGRRRRVRCCRRSGPRLRTDHRRRRWRRWRQRRLHPREVADDFGRDSFARSAVGSCAPCAQHGDLRTHGKPNSRRRKSVHL